MKNKENKTPKLNKNDKIGIVAVVALAIVALALVSLGLGALVTENEPETPWVSGTVISTASDISTTAGTTITTTQSVQLSDTSTTASVVPTTVLPSESTTAPTTTEVPTTKGEPTKEEILKIVTDGVNALKASDASYVGTKTQNIVIDVTDCSYPAFLGIINGVVKMIANEEVLDYDFTNGVCIDPEENVEVSAMNTIPPVGTPFALTAEGVASASYEKIGDNTKYSVTLVPETGTYQQPKPTHHGVACDTLNFSLFDIPAGEITKSDFNYPGATVTVTLDKDGKVVGYSEHIDMDGVGEGNAFGITATASMEGYIDESWKIVWK
ncbi:MAG: hypothetical protein IJ491_06840 [Clostridia bacterium]|nr:hypothetical protein [Clostridia bacterium]